MSSDFQVALLTAPADASRNLEQRSTLSFFERNVRELSPGGVRSSIFTLISTTLGAGVLALPFVLQQSGLIIGTMLIGVAGILALVTITIIMKASTRLGLKTYAQIVAHCAGSWAQEALDLVIFVYINGAMAAYFIFLGDFLPIVVRQFGAPVIFGQRWFIMLMGICIGIPMCMPRQLSSLRHVTPVSTLALLALSVTAVVYMPQLHADRSASGEEVRLSSITWSIIPSFNICMFSFVCHNNVVPVAVELDNPSDRRIMKVASSTAVGCCLFYFIIAQAGYLSFMDETGSNFLVNYPSQQFLPSLCRCLFIISLTVGVVVNNHSAVASFVGFLQRCVFSDSIRGLQYNANISDQANDVDSAGYIAEGVSDRQDSFGFLNAVRTAVICFSFCFQAYVAYVFPDAGKVLSLLGGTLGTVIAVVIPLIIFNAVLAVEHSKSLCIIVNIYLTAATIFGFVGAFIDVIS